jgi:lipid A ethanolaminephosphotransferase
MHGVASLNSHTAVDDGRGLALSYSSIGWAATAWMVTLSNLPFWSALIQAEGGVRDGNLLYLLSVPFAILAWVYASVLLLTWGRATKPVLALLLIASAVSSYFTYAFGVLIDEAMITSVIETHRAEALDLSSWRMAVWVLTLGVLPAMFLAKIRVVRQRFTRELLTKTAHFILAAACLALVLIANYQHYASTLRNHRDLRYMLVPHNIIAGLYRYVSGHWHESGALEVVGADAHRLTSTPAATRPMLAVLVIGETARAQNFSLNGYERATNTELARYDVLSFSNVTACGTTTAVSLPCMFSDLGHMKNKSNTSIRREGLLDVLQRAGFNILWLDNNSGCKGVCTRVPHESMSSLPMDALCRAGECYDGIFVRALQQRILQIEADTVLVLHMIGSHGPAYFKRYPEDFEIFSPACRSAELSRCSRDSIVNAYDNSIRYTDHVLSRILDTLHAIDSRFDTAMLYVSDHGESLGEKGLYLHGLPYAVAPREQVHVPMLMWLSPGMRQRLGLDLACLSSHRDDALTHDNLFHSVLGLVRVHTGAYIERLDFLRACRSSA